MSACSSASSKKPTVCEKSSVSLSSSDSESVRLPLVDVDFSSSAASSTSEASRPSVFSSVHALCVMPLLLYCSRCALLLFIAIFLMTIIWVPDPSCCDPPSSRSSVSVLSGIEPISDSLMIRSRTATTLRVLGTYTRYPLSPSVLPTNFLFSALGSSLLTSLSRFLMKTVKPKIYSLLIESLGFIPRISSAGHFFSSHNQIFHPCCMGNCCSPHHLGRHESMSKHLAISRSVLLHLSAKQFCYGVSCLIFSCRMLASKQNI